MKNLKFLIVMLILAAACSYTSEAQKIIPSTILSNALSVDVNTPEIYLGWINPDGVKPLYNSYEMVFVVSGAPGAKFNTYGHFYSHQGTPVYISGSTWYYSGKNRQDWEQISAQDQFQYDQGKLDGEGYAYYKLIPGLLFAAPNATTGYYEFVVEVSVSYTSI